MKIEELVELPKESIIKLFEVLARDQKTIDGFWFLAVEEAYGLEHAVEFDTAVWSKVGRINAQRLQKIFNLNKPGISAFLEAFRLDPLSIFFDYELEVISPNRVVMRFTNCPAQKGRLKMGKEVFPCRSLDEGYFTGFAKAIDPHIQVHCGFCPPEKYSDDLWCEWHFSIDEQNG